MHKIDTQSVSIGPLQLHQCSAISILLCNVGLTFCRKCHCAEDMVLHWGSSDSMGNSNADISFHTKCTPLHHKCAYIAAEIVNEKTHGATYFGGTHVQPHQCHVHL